MAKKRFSPGQAIFTKEVSRGIKASAQAGDITVPWVDLPHGPYNTRDTDHLEAAKAYAKEMGWAGTWVGGANPKGDGYAFCLNFSDGSSKFSFRRS